MHKVFISYHHANDQSFKDHLLWMNTQHDIFIDGSVDTGDISDDLKDEAIREKIRDEYLRDSTVTILLVGLETQGRKHVDWELYSSMIDGTVNKKSGILVVNLPPINCAHYTAAHGDIEKKTVYPDNNSWQSILERKEYNNRYPYMPDRIVDNLLKNEALISVVDWYKIADDPEIFSFLIEWTFSDRSKCQYDLSTPMRRANS